MWIRFCGFWLLIFTLGTAQAAAPTILIWGDSLSAAYGINIERGWVALLRERLKAEGYPQQVINASVSGETTTGGLQRLPTALKQHQPKFVLIELGANDGLRGQPLTTMRNNLGKMITLSRKAGATPVLFEMRLPSNYGETYTLGFQQSFASVAKAMKLPMVPFWLGAIATDPKNFQDDGIHPTEVVQSQLLDAVWPTLNPLLKK